MHMRYVLTRWKISGLSFISGTHALTVASMNLIYSPELSLLKNWNIYNSQEGVYIWTSVYLEFNSGSIVEWYLTLPNAPSTTMVSK